MKNKFIFSICTVFGLITVSLLSSCNKDEGPSTIPGGNAFFNFDGQVFIGAYNSVVDTSSVYGKYRDLWAGQAKGSRYWDTFIEINHNGDYKIGKFTIDTGLFEYAPGTVTISAHYGTDFTNSTDVRVTSGDFEMKRENNRWVAYLTNGKGRKVHGTAIIYNNISMKFIHPF